MPIPPPHLLRSYHAAKNGSNWLTERYLEMMIKASDDDGINFKVHCIEMYVIPGLYGGDI